MHDIKSIDARLNDMILHGQALKACEEFYAEDVALEEPNGVVEGKEANRDYQRSRLAEIATLHDARLKACAVHGNVSFSEWHWDMTLKSGPRVQVDEVAVRRYDERGKVVHVRSYLS